MLSWVYDVCWAVAKDSCAVVHVANRPILYEAGYADALHGAFVRGMCR
jgi:hypothetical protein